MRENVVRESIIFQKDGWAGFLHPSNAQTSEAALAFTLSVPLLMNESRK